MECHQGQEQPWVCEEGSARQLWPPWAGGQAGRELWWRLDVPTGQAWDVQGRETGAEGLAVGWVLYVEVCSDSLWVESPLWLP